MLNSAIRIPPEISDELMHLCCVDTSALKNFGLVCKSWLPASRYHLYMTTTIYPRNCLAFFKLLQSPFCTIRPFICHLEIEDLANTVVQTFSDPVALEAVRTLRLRNINWGALELGAKEGFWSSFRGVKELGLSRVSFEKFDDFIELINSFPALERMSLREIDYEGHRCSSARKVRNFAPHCAIPAIHTVVLESLLPREVPWICKFVQVLGASLKDLTLDTGELFQNAAEGVSGWLFASPMDQGLMALT
jgi:hypothetical protein